MSETPAPPPPPSAKKYPRRTILKAPLLLVPRFRDQLEVPGYWSEYDKTPPEIRLYIESMLKNNPKIGGAENRNVALEEGVGWATFWASELGPTSIETLQNRREMLEVNPSLSPYSKSVLEIVDSDTRATLTNLKSRLTSSQALLSPQQAIESGQYIGILATRGGWNDIGKAMLIWNQEQPGSHIKFIGRALVGDNSGNWGLHGNWPYSLKPWNQSGYNKKGLEWITDASTNIKRLCLTGHQENQLIRNAKYDPNKLDAATKAIVERRGEPGIILISENRFKELI